MSFAYFKETIRNTVAQPAIIFIMILQIAIMMFVALGMSFEYHHDVLLSVSLLGRSPLEGEGLLVFRKIAENFIHLGWSIFMFLYIIGTAASFTEMFKDPLLNILLTKKHSRIQILCSRYYGIVASVLFLQVLFSLFIVLVFFLKTHLVFLWILLPMIIIPGVLFLVLTSLSGFLGIIFENSTVTMVITLVVYYFSEFFTSGALVPDPFLKFIAYLFPPLSSLDKIFIDLMIFRNTDGAFPYHCFVYAICYFAATIIVFKRMDL
jgi:ABC-type transport system involved in multi-copper enzyme maturation permease subunit